MGWLSIPSGMEISGALRESSWSCGQKIIRRKSMQKQIRTIPKKIKWNQHHIITLWSTKVSCQACVVHSRSQKHLPLASMWAAIHQVKPSSNSVGPSNGCHLHSLESQVPKCCGFQGLKGSQWIEWMEWKDECQPKSVGSKVWLDFGWFCYINQISRCEMDRGKSHSKLTKRRHKSEFKT